MEAIDAAWDAFIRCDAEGRYDYFCRMQARIAELEADKAQVIGCNRLQAADISKMERTIDAQWREATDKVLKRHLADPTLADELGLFIERRVKEQRDG